jgi:hypothetical protein
MAAGLPAGAFRRSTPGISATMLLIDTAMTFKAFGRPVSRR